MGKNVPLSTHKTLTKSEKNYSQIEKEGLSIILGVQKFRHYLLGRKFLLRTDHRPLVSLFDVIKVTTPTRTSSRLARWALQLIQFDYDIEYRRWADHGNADCLSRFPVGDDLEFEEFSESEDNTERYVAALECQFIADGPIRYPKLQEYTNADPVLQQIMRYLQNGWPSKLKDPGLKSFASCQ